MFPSQRPMTFVRRSLALTAIFGASVALASAQNTSPVSGTNDQAQTSTLNLHVPPVDTSSSSLFSSSASNNEEPTLVASNDRFTPPMNAMQYNGGRRYGRPRYRGGNTNQDGSKKYEFFVDGGFTAPVTDNSNFLKTSWAFGVGGGRNFSNRTGVNVEFNWDNFGLTNSTINNQLALYNQIISYYNQQNPGNQAGYLTSLNGNNHTWSFSIDPHYNLTGNHDGINLYAVGGVGFYHKVTNFTVPTVGTYCDYYYGCYQYQANQIIDHYTSNAAGLNGGFGLAYKLSRFSNEQIFAEARYVYVFNSPRPGVTINNINQANANNLNDFPQNSQRTAYMPIKFGIRF